MSQTLTPPLILILTPEQASLADTENSRFHTNSSFLARILAELTQGEVALVPLSLANGVAGGLQCASARVQEALSRMECRVEAARRVVFHLLCHGNPHSWKGSDSATTATWEKVCSTLAGAAGGSAYRLAGVVYYGCNGAGE